jgi:hypothetical protein
MMVTMTVVVAKHTAMILTADPGIDISEAVFNHASSIAPNFLFENSAASPASEVGGVVNDFRRFGSLPRLLPGHGRIIAQLGYYKSDLKAGPARLSV